MSKNETADEYGRRIVRRNLWIIVLLSIVLGGFICLGMSERSKKQSERFRAIFIGANYVKT